MSLILKIHKRAILMLSKHGPKNKLKSKDKEPF